MIKSFIIFFVILTSTSFLALDDYLEWSPENKLTFSDFKATVPKYAYKSKNSAHLTTIVSYKTKQIKGKIPEVTLYNRVNRDKSWIAKKTKSVLESQQVHFDLSELYTRKIRKEIATLNKKNITDINVYKNVIKKHTTNLAKEQEKHLVDMTNHKQLFAIWKKNVADSLKLYKGYSK